MATYLIICLPFVAFATACWLVCKQKFTKSFALSLILLLLLTAVFDSLIIWAGIVDYETSKILGVYIIRSPVEDFLYTVSAVLLVSALWKIIPNTKEKTKGD